MDSSEILEQQRARLLDIVDAELDRIHKHVARGRAGLLEEDRRTLETLTRIIKELEKRELRETKPGTAVKELSPEEIIGALSGPPSGEKAG